MEAVLTNSIETKEVTLETKEDRIKTHPRMYPVAYIHFEDEVAIMMNAEDKISVSFEVKNAIMKGIETAGFSLTIDTEGTVTVNAIRKQLQHDA